MPLILTKRIVKRIIERALDRAKKNFGILYPVDIDIKLTFAPKFLIEVDRERRRVRFILGRFTILSGRDLESLIKYHVLKLFSYQYVCPFDVGMASEIIKSAIEKAGYPLGTMVSSMLIEILNDAYLIHLDTDLVYEAYMVMRKIVGRDRGLITNIHLALINLVYGQEIFDIEDEEVMRIASEIYDVIFKRNINDPVVWPKIAADMAKILGEIIKREEVESQSEGLDRVMRYRVGEIILPLMAVQVARGGEYSMKAFKLMYDVSGKDLSSAAPLLLGTVALKPKEILRLWYRERARELVRIVIKEQVRVVRHKIEYPDTWCLGDEIDKLDVNISVNISPIMVPGYTTKKWNVADSAPQKIIKIAPDVLIIVDSSGSMGRLHGYEIPRISGSMKKLMRKLGITYVIGSKFDLAVLTAFGILEYALNLGSDVAVVNFSDVPIYTSFCMNRTLLEDTIMVHQNGGTYFPVKTVRKLLEGRRNVLVIVISDAEIWNRRTAGAFLRRLAREQTLYFFHIELPDEYLVLERVREGGGFIISVPDPNKLPEVVLSVASRHVREIVEYDPLSF